MYVYVRGRKNTCTCKEERVKEVSENLALSLRDKNTVKGALSDFHVNVNLRVSILIAI